jgi:ABC-type Fe3+-hydroxamate transport system substrate-binding protein
MAAFTDQLNRTINLTDTPKKIISLVPSQTELLYDLGLHNEVIGITKFCIHPTEWFRTKPRVGGTKKYDFEKIKNLNPDLIIGNKEENEQVQIETLMKNYNVWMSDIYTLKDALDMIIRLGTLVGKAEEATFLKLKIESEFKKCEIIKPNSTLKAAYLIWKNPYMVAGKNTFITEMLHYCGFNNVFDKEEFIRYPQITIEQLKHTQPDVIFLSSEPYPFNEKHIAEFKTSCKNTKVILVDGELFSWYGSRLLQAPAYFLKLLNQYFS